MNSIRLSLPVAAIFSMAMVVVAISGCGQRPSNDAVDTRSPSSVSDSDPVSSNPSQDGGILRVWVADSGGDPVANQTLTPEAVDVPGGHSFGEKVYRTDSEGRYEWSDLPAGTYRVTAGHEEGAPSAEGTVATGETAGIEIVMTE